MNEQYSTSRVNVALVYPTYQRLLMKKNMLLNSINELKKRIANINELPEELTMTDDSIIFPGGYGLQLSNANDADRMNVLKDGEKVGDVIYFYA